MAAILNFAICSGGKHHKTGIMKYNTVARVHLETRKNLIVPIVYCIQGNCGIRGYCGIWGYCYISPDEMILFGI